MLLCTWLCAGLGALAAAGPSLDGLAAVRSVLQRTEGAATCPDDVLVRRLTALGSPAAPALFSVATGEAVEELLGESEADAWLCPPDRVGVLALTALANLPPQPVRQCLRAGATRRPERDVRVAAMNVLGLQGSAEGFPLFFQLLAESGEELELRSVRTQVQDALIAILRTDRSAARALDAPLVAASLAEQKLVCEALARSGRAEAAGSMLKLIGRDPELDLLCLEGTAELLLAHPWRMPESAAANLRSCLDHTDKRLRAAAARALGRLGDPQAVAGLIAHIKDPDPATARAARWALEESTGQTRLDSVEEWQAWLEAERAWWKEEGRERVETLAEGEPGELAAAMRAVLAHPLHRNQVAEALTKAMSGFDPGQKAVACAALAQLGARQSVPVLVELLFDTDPSVREAAWTALRMLTGQDLPAEPRLWEEFAFG